MDMAMTLRDGGANRSSLVSFLSRPPRTNAVDSLIWRGNAPVWCDISTHFPAGFNLAIPACSLCINRRLYQIASLRTVTKTNLAEKRRAILVGCVSAIYALLSIAPFQLPRKELLGGEVGSEEGGALGGEQYGDEVRFVSLSHTPSSSSSYSHRPSPHSSRTPSSGRANIMAVFFTPVGGISYIIKETSFGEVSSGRGAPLFFAQLFASRPSRLPPHANSTACHLDRMPEWDVGLERPTLILFSSTHASRTSASAGRTNAMGLSYVDKKKSFGRLSSDVGDIV
ncbi:hypothetical protein B0H12DRAFT_1245360 [Mycena haematopus]|nr:hypothetical protein B0H12DRAFT_1245360 [Mycena haematopus]